MTMRNIQNDKTDESIFLKKFTGVSHRICQTATCLLPLLSFRSQGACCHLERVRPKVGAQRY